MRKTLLAVAAAVVCVSAFADSASACCRRYYGCGWGYGCCYVPCYTPCYYVPSCCGYGYGYGGGYYGAYYGGDYYGYATRAANSLYTYRTPTTYPSYANRLYAPTATVSRLKPAASVAPASSVLTPVKAEIAEPAVSRAVRYTYN